MLARTHAAKSCNCNVSCTCPYTCTAESVVGSLTRTHNPLDMSSDWPRKGNGLCKLRNALQRNGPR